MAGDFAQLPPVFDTILYSDEKRNPSSDYGRQLFELFDDVIILNTVVRQDESELELRGLIENMRRGAAASEYDYDFVKSKRLHNLPNEEKL
eukprot:4884309-Prymnesium_polylepis.1